MACHEPCKVHGYANSCEFTWRMCPEIFVVHDQDSHICCGFFCYNNVMYYVYALKSLCKDFIYVGYSTNLKQRFEYHQNGYVKSTKAFCPFELIFYEAYKSKADAKRREMYLKSTKGKSTLRLMLRESLK